MRNYALIAFCLGSILLFFSLGCKKERTASPLPECVFPQFLPAGEITGSVVVDYDGKTREGTAGVLLDPTVSPIEQVTAVLRYCNSPFATRSLSTLYVPTEVTGDTIIVNDRCFGERCPTDFPTSRISSWSSDVQVATYALDEQRYNWIVVQNWDEASKRLEFTFEMHFFRNLINVTYDDDVAPPYVSLTNGRFDAFYLEE